MKKKQGPQTLGGTQFWRDRLVVDDHRIQQHVRFGRVRVLDPYDRRLHTGTTYSAALAAFTKAVGTSHQRGDHLVVLLHGYGGKATPRMVPLRDAVRAAGFVAEVVQYPSFFRTVDELASSITDLVAASAAHHRGIKQVSLVAFSLGGLVASAVMAKLALRKGTPRLGRLVTVGTPHLGSRIANFTKWLTFIGGPNITELVVRDRRELAVLQVPLGVVAGRGFINGWVLLGLLGDGDGVVELESALGVGAADSLMVNGVKHTRLPAHSEVVEGVVRFLKTGQFK